MRITRAAGGVISGTYIYCDPVGCYLGHALKGRAGVSSRPVQATWPHKINAKAAVLPSSLAKHSTVTVLADLFWGQGEILKL